MSALSFFILCIIRTVQTSDYCLFNVTITSYPSFSDIIPILNLYLNQVFGPQLWADLIWENLQSWLDRFKIPEHHLSNRSTNSMPSYANFYIRFVRLFLNMHLVLSLFCKDFYVNFLCHFPFYMSGKKKKTMPKRNSIHMYIFLKTLFMFQYHFHTGICRI